MKIFFLQENTEHNDIYFDYTFDLNCPLELSENVVGLLDLTGCIQSRDERRKSPLYLCCDICEESNVSNTVMPIIQQIYRTQGGTISNNINHIIKLTRHSISKIRLYIVDVSGNLQPLANCNLSSALGFKNEETYY